MKVEENFASASVPVFKASERTVQDAFDIALENLLKINTVECPSDRYNKTGLLNEGLGLMIRAGAQYSSPWTRDAAVNSWNCASILEPAVAENTLWAVCERNENGKLILQKDEQTWDKIIWAIGAWNHYLVTGKQSFLKYAYEVVSTTLPALEETCFNSHFGLFTGGSFFNDGISGYPEDLHEPGNKSSFVGDHPLTRSIMALSTNCIYQRAYIIASQMAELCSDTEAAAEYLQKGEAVKFAINRHFWDETRSSYDYIIYPDGQKCHMQEAAGLSFVLLFGICDNMHAERMLNNIQTLPYGLASILPPFNGLFSEEHPGRHNNLIWPFINGFFITAASQYGKAEFVGAEIRRIAQLVRNCGNKFFEIYNPYTGKVDGGWQTGKHWGSCRHQTWSASAYIRSILHGLFGLSLGEDGILFRPCVPAGWNGVSLKGLCIRNLSVDLSILGTGTKVHSVRINGTAQEHAFLPFSKSGKFHIEIAIHSV